MKLGILLLLFYLPVVVTGQVASQQLQEFTSRTSAQISTHRSTGVPSFVRFPILSPLQLTGTTAASRVEHFVAEYGELFGSKNLMEKMRLVKTQSDRYGFKHLTYQQYHLGVPVYDGLLRFHFDSRHDLRSINGVHIPIIKVNPIPTISGMEAVQLAIGLVADQLNRPEGVFFLQDTTLQIFRKGLAQGWSGANYLVYQVVVASHDGVREFVFVNAHDGTIVEHFTGNHGTLCRTLFEINKGDTTWQEGDAFPGGLNQWQQNELETAAHTYHFFLNTFGRDSYDDAGAKMETINNSAFVNCPNANWNGSFVNFCNGTASDDIVAHEWGHAVTEYTSNLIYQWQSGALNESYSDIWGETIDLINGYEDRGEDLSVRTSCASSERWKMGEDASAFGGAIRDMWDPTCSGDPGKVSDTEYHCSTTDNGGVHINSGVNNHAYALLVDGGTYNGQTIQPLGLTKAAHIFWRANANYLTATSDFSVQADALEMACMDLIGIDLEGLSTTATPAGPSGEIISASDQTELQKVLMAVEMRLAPNCGFTPLLDEDTLLCASSIPELAIFYEDFEDGFGGWTVDTAETSYATWEDRNWEVVSSLPNGRSGSAAFGIDPLNGDCDTDLQSGILRLQSPIINIPGSISGSIEMAFDHYVAMEPFWDGGNIKYSIGGGAWTLLPGSAFSTNGYIGSLNGGVNDNPLAGESAFTKTDEGSVSGSWGTSVLSLSSLGLMPDQSIQFRFELGTDGCNGRIGWYIDDIRIFSCGDCQPSLQLAALRIDQGILFEAGVDITTGDTIQAASSIVYSAAQEIQIEPGFQVQQGAVIEVKIDGCDVPSAPPKKNQTRKLHSVLSEERK